MQPGAPAEGSTWTPVIGKKQLKKQRKKAAQHQSKTNMTEERATDAMEKRSAGDRRVPTTVPARSANRDSTTKRRRPPRTAAVAIKGVTEDFSYSAALRQLRDKISLPDLKISKTSVRHAANGGLFIEISGLDKNQKAEILRQRVSSVLGDTAAVTRPVIKGDVPLVGLDDSVGPDEVADTIASEGGCEPRDVKVGTIGPMTNGLRTVWAQCPLGAAIKASQSGKLRIGWTIARIELLKARPVQCFRCWGHGHLKIKCSSPVDRYR